MWPGVEVKFKIWFEVSGKPLLGEGGYELLKAVEEEGSIMGACRKLGLSYRKALNYIRRLEGLLGKKVLLTKRGGPGGGKAVLTDDARALVRAYEVVKEAVERTIRKVGLTALADLGH